MCEYASAHKSSYMNMGACTRTHATRTHTHRQSVAPYKAAAAAATTATATTAVYMNSMLMSMLLDRSRKNCNAARIHEMARCAHGVCRCSKPKETTIESDICVCVCVRTPMCACMKTNTLEAFKTDSMSS